MKAAVFHGTGQPVTVEEWPTPEPGPTELLIRVAACGVCHTDLHYLDHGTPTFKAPPLVLGHEISGVVEEVGIKAVGFELGDRVLIAAVLSCGTCEACRTGRENICQNSVMLGNNVDGGFAEFVTAPAKDVFHLPDEIPLIEGSVIADAVTTPYHAVVNRGRITPGDQVVVIGCGGVGLNVVQVATAVGAEVVAVDTSADKRDWAVKLGASAVVDPSAVERLDREVRRLTGGGAHVAFEVVGKAATQQQAVSCVRTGGRVVFVGYSPEKMSLNSGRIMFRELEIVGSLGCRPVDYPRAIELVRQGRVQVEPLVTHRHSLDEIGAAFDAARAGTGVRGVVTP